jgi:hypothetical protein
MIMTRNGKIARLPKAIRDQLNKNLEDGMPGCRLVDWLNTLPEVHQVLTEQFDGRAINEVNLSEWKAGGYLDWQARQDMQAHAQELAEEATDLKAALPVALAEHLNVVVAGRYAELLNKWNGEVDEAFVKKLKALRLLNQDVAVLRRGDLAVGDQALRAERLALEKKQFDNAMRCDETKALERCLDECKEYPEAADTFREGFALLKEYEEGKKKNGAYLARKDAERKAEAERQSREYWEKRRLEDEAKERERQERHAKIDARKARWQAAHPGQDPQAGKWWAWQPEEETQQE